MRGHRPPSPSLPRIAFALLAALGFFLGTTEVHSASADHLVGRGFGGQVAEGASHPNESHHVEPSETRVHPPCPACLLQLQTVAAGIAAAAVLPLPDSADAPAGRATARRQSPLPRLGSPRGPPSLPAR